jgi:hypothetical protein
MRGSVKSPLPYCAILSKGESVDRLFAPVIIILGIVAQYRLSDTIEGLYKESSRKAEKSTSPGV